MAPIVNGLQEQYGDQMLFVELNARDGDQGEAAFRATNLRGHPAFLILQPEGREVWRGIGEQPPGPLEEAIQDVLKEELAHENE